FSLGLQRTATSLLDAEKSGGGGWIRTNVGVSQQIYSLPPLATRAPLQGTVNYGRRGIDCQFPERHAAASEPRRGCAARRPEPRCGAGGNSEPSVKPARTSTVNYVAAPQTTAAAPASASSGPAAPGSASAPAASAVGTRWPIACSGTVNARSTRRASGGIPC